MFGFFPGYDSGQGRSELLNALAVALVVLCSATAGIYLGYTVGYSNGVHAAESAAARLAPRLHPAPFNWNTFAPLAPDAIAGPLCPVPD